MRLSDLNNAKIKTLDGKTLGRVHDVHVKDDRVVGLACGPGGLVERFTARRHGRVIPWECVCNVRDGEVIVTSEKADKRASGSRTRRRTPPASGRRSKR